MGVTIEAVFENGVLRPLGELGLQENERVRVVVLPRGLSVEETAGMLGPVPEDLLRFIAEDDSILEDGV